MKKKYMNRIEEILLFRSKLALLSGPRGCGKTTFILNKLTQLKNCKYKILLIVKNYYNIKYSNEKLGGNYNNITIVSFNNLQRFFINKNEKYDIIINEEILTFNDFSNKNNEKNYALDLVLNFEKKLLYNNGVIINTSYIPNFFSNDFSVYMKLNNLCDTSLIINPIINGKTYVSGKFFDGKNQIISDFIDHLN